MVKVDNNLFTNPIYQRCGKKLDLTEVIYNEDHCFDCKWKSLGLVMKGVHTNL
jgi:hypothetical protein